MRSQDFIDSLLSLVPPVLVGGIFYLIMRGILRADRTERKVYAEMEAKMRAAQAQSEQPTNAKK
jgi:preprotein translocase subunit YajC